MLKHLKKLVNSPFLINKNILKVGLSKTITSIIESYMNSSCTLAEAFATLDKASSYAYFPLHSDFSEGWKKSNKMKKALTLKDLKNPIGVGGILYLHNTSNGCFKYSIASHKLLSPYGQKIKNYPNSLRKKILDSVEIIKGLQGDLILFDDRGFHGPDQPSSKDRRVIIFDYYRDKTFGSTVVEPHKVKINDLEIFQKNN